MKYRTLYLLNILIVAILGTSCSTPQKQTTLNTAKGERPSTPALHKEMTGEAVINIIGEPKKIEEKERDGLTFQIWHYKNLYKLEQGLEATSLVEIPYFDPITGEEKTEYVPQYEILTENLVISTELLMFENKLLEWKQKVQSTIDYH